MINNYEIRKTNNDEVLYIFIDDSYEFARINKGKKRKKFLEMVNDFIRENNIRFAGSTIAIVAGGLIIGNLFLHSTDDMNLKNCIVSLHLNPQINETEVASSDFLENTSIDVEVQEVDHSIDNNVEIINEKVLNQDDKTNLETEINIQASKEISQETNSNKKEIKETVTVFRSNGNILNLEMEEYLINVVAAEMPANFNIEALKAQSVLARTYARKIILNGKVLTDSVSTQVYKDNSELKSLWGNNFDKYYSKIKEAVMATSGEVLKYKGDYIEAVYHSTSNGFTEDASNVWGNSFPYLKVVESKFDKATKNYEVITFYSYSKLSNLLGFAVDSLVDFNILERNASSRVKSVSIGENNYSGVQLRNILGLRSADFEFEKTDDGINIITYGYGHGVGMSQYGANEMAKNGFSYKDILNHYYSGTSLLKETP